MLHCQLRILVELIWPLVLFLILAWVKTRNLQEFRHECKFFFRSIAEEQTFFQVIMMGNLCRRLDCCDLFKDLSVRRQMNVTRLQLQTRAQASSIHSTIPCKHLSRYNGLTVLKSQIVAINLYIPYKIMNMLFEKSCGVFSTGILCPLLQIIALAKKISVL